MDLIFCVDGEVVARARARHRIGVQYTSFFCYVRCCLLQAETKLKEFESVAYINPDKSLEAKEEGNKFFKDGKGKEAHAIVEKKS